MTKSELIERVAEVNQGLPAKDIEMAVNEVMNLMVNTLLNSGRVEIRGFGSFSIRHRAPRRSRNPRTGEEVHLGPKKAIHFKPGKGLREAVDASKEVVDIMPLS